ncbi:MAG TPA: hypothetical protein VNU01_00715 [Egibacteraceae bacterium]|nr:hypothetical protein [Egibacteraceae bacterium]
MAGAAASRRQWTSCVAAVVVLIALLTLVFPVVRALAGPQPAAPASSPVLVRVTPATGALGGGRLEPGVADYRPVEVHNDGTVAFRYDLTVSARGPLVGIVLVEFRGVARHCDAATFAAGERVAGPAPMGLLVREGGRTLAPGASELLCARVELPDGARTPSAEPTDAVLRVSAVQR